MTTIREQTIRESAAALAWNIKAMVNYSDIVTFKYIEQRGEKLEVWSINDQIAHVHSEVAEVFQAFRHREGTYKALSENIDVLLSAVTLLTIIRLNTNMTKVELNNAIDSACYEVTKKLYKRAGITLE